jgi:molybdate transport system substrate-binding protein
MGRRLAAGATAAVAVALVAGCGSSSSDSGGGGTLHVFAAASLTEAFTTLGRSFEAAHPGTKVVFNFGPSSGLAQQITAGAPADVFASASPTTMQQVVAKGAAASSTPFVENVMEIAVPPDNPAAVDTLADLAKRGVKVAVCQPQVPCGATAQKVFANAHVTVKPVTEEVDVKSVLSKVELGEVDAGVVYVTDVRAAGVKVKGVPIPAPVNASTTYPIAALAKGGKTAQAFVSYVLSPAGADVLTRAGFERP